MSINIEDLTLRQIKELQSLTRTCSEDSAGLNSMIGQKVIIRTDRAGVHYGLLERKSGNEVILKNARRLWYWKTKKSISLSAVAKYGLNEEESKVCPAVDMLWLEAIEILPCSTQAVNSIEECKDVEAR